MIELEHGANGDIVCMRNSKKTIKSTWKILFIVDAILVAAMLFLFILYKRGEDTFGIIVLFASVFFMWLLLHFFIIRELKNTYIRFENGKIIFRKNRKIIEIPYGSLKSFGIIRTCGSPTFGELFMTTKYNAGYTPSDNYDTVFMSLEKENNYKKIIRRARNNASNRFINSGKTVIIFSLEKRSMELQMWLDQIKKYYDGRDVLFVDSQAKKFEKKKKRA